MFTIPSHQHSEIGVADPSPSGKALLFRPQLENPQGLRPTPRSRSRCQYHPRARVVYCSPQLLAKSAAAFAELVKTGEGRIRLDKVPIAVAVEDERLLPRHRLRAAVGGDVLGSRL